MLVNTKKVLQLSLLLVCLIAIVTTNARRQHRRRGGRRGGGRRAGASPGGEQVEWTRELEGDTPITVEESAFIASEHNIVIVNSNDNASVPLGYQTTVTYYGFAGPEPIMAIATAGNRHGHPCFLVTPDKTYDELVADVRARNGTTVSTNEVQELSAIGNLMERPAVQTLVRQHPMLRRVCRRNRMFDTRVSAPASSEPTATAPRLLKTLTFYSVAEITFPAPSARRGGRHGRGRQHRNRQGGGRRANRGQRRGGRGGARAGRRRQGGGARAGRGGRRGRQGQVNQNGQGIPRRGRRPG